MKFKVMSFKLVSEFEAALNEQYAAQWVLQSWQFDNTDSWGRIVAVFVKAGK